MEKVFAASEIVELGIEIEKNGRDFYNTLAGKSRDEEAGKLFRMLARQETKHIVAFKRILAQEGSGAGLDSVSGEYSGYLNALIREEIFTTRGKGRQIASCVKSQKEAIALAIGFEKDSIIFYEAMKQVLSEAAKRITDELIVQEQRHLEKLVRIKNRQR